MAVKCNFICNYSSKNNFARSSYCMIFNRLANFNIFLLIFVLCSRTEFVNAANNTDINCSNVKYTYETKGLNARQIPNSPLSGDHLRVCSAGLTCCTEEMEHLLAAQSKLDFEKAVRDSLTTLSQVLKARALKFDELFKELLANSKRDFHEMFKRTYGTIYEQNSYVFTDLFEELERYYSKGRVDLLESMENFFNTLYQKMFTVLNSQYKFEDKYLGCVSEHMKELKPFGDVPQKLSVQLKRSFVATRTLAQALNIAGDIASNMANINPSEGCTRAVMKMTQCPACRGLPDLKACSSYCINVMKGCLAYHTELDSEWNGFVYEMDRLVDRLLGPFNIEMVVQPIDIKISEAIMNFQENSNQVSQRVFSGCGKPILGRKKRFVRNEKVYKIPLPLSMQRYRRAAAGGGGANSRSSPNGGELSLETLQFSRAGQSNNRKNHNKDDNDDDNSDGGLGLGKLLKDIRSRIKETKQFWARLPYQMCNGESVATGPGKDDSCWNGAQKARYEGKVAGDGISNQQSNPEVTVDLSRPSTLLNEQIYALKTINNKLRSAYTGMDVEWIDTEESFGSGSGSGMPPEETDDTERDDEDSGSGMGGSPVDNFHPDSGVSKNDEDNRLHPVLEGNESKSNFNSTHGVNSANSHNTRVSLNRALVTYLVPVVMMWFGNSINEWIQ